MVLVEPLGKKHRNLKTNIVKFSLLRVQQTVLFMNRISVQNDIKPLSEVRAHIKNLIRQVRESKRPLVITQRGQSAVVLMDAERYDHLRFKLALLESIREAQGEIESGHGILHSKVKEELLKKYKK